MKLKRIIISLVVLFSIAANAISIVGYPGEVKADSGVFQVEAGADDAYSRGNDAANSYTTTYLLVEENANPASTDYWCSGHRLETTIPQGSTITSANLSLYYYNAANNDLDGFIYAHDVDSSDNFSVDTSVVGRTRTSANVSWQELALSGAQWITSPDITDVVQEVVNRPGYDGIITIIIIAGTDGSNALTYRAFEGSAEQAAYISVEWTSGGSAPSVTTVSSNSTDEYGNGKFYGNITNVNGDNAHLRGFYYDTDNVSGASSNTSASGNFSAGVYNRDFALAPGEAYEIRAFAVNDYGMGVGSDLWFITQGEGINPPTLTAGATWVNITWSYLTGSDHVSVNYQTGSYPSDNLTGTQAYFGSGTSVNVTSLSSSTTYYFTIINYSYDEGLHVLNSFTTEQHTKTTLAQPPPNAPQSLFCSRDGFGSLVITWTDSVSPSCNATRILIGFSRYPSNNSTGIQVYEGTLEKIDISEYSDPLRPVYIAGYSWNDNGWSSPSYYLYDEEYINMEYLTLFLIPLGFIAYFFTKNVWVGAFIGGVGMYATMNTSFDSWLNIAGVMAVSFSVGILMKHAKAHRTRV